MRLNKGKRCERVRPYWEFSKHPSTSTRLSTVCKACHNAKVRAEYHKDVEQTRLEERTRKRGQVKSDRTVIRMRLFRRMQAVFGHMNRKQAEQLLGGSWDRAIDHLLAALPTGKGVKDLTIDHVIPLRAACGDEQMKRKVCHYTNLQWLTRSENSSKRDHVPATSRESAAWATASPQ